MRQYRGQWCCFICNAGLREKRALYYLNFFNFKLTGNDLCKNFIVESILFEAFEKLAFIHNSMSMIWKSIRFSKDVYYKCLRMRHFKYFYTYAYKFHNLIFFLWGIWIKIYMQWFECLFISVMFLRLPNDMYEEKPSFIEFENNLWRMDQQTNGPTYGPKEGRTDSCRDARLDKKIVNSYITNVSFRDIRIISLPSLHLLCCTLFIIWSSPLEAFELSKLIYKAKSMI